MHLVEARHIAHYYRNGPEVNLVSVTMILDEAFSSLLRHKVIRSELSARRRPLGQVNLKCAKSCGATARSDKFNVSESIRFRVPVNLL